MKKINSLKSNISPDFEKFALEIFQFQAKNNLVYKEFIELLNISPTEISNVTDIPFLPIEFSLSALARKFQLFGHGPSMYACV